MRLLTMAIRAIIIGLSLLLTVVLPHRAGAAVIEQVIAVIDGEPYTLTNLRSFAKSRLAKSFPTGSLQDINAADRDVLEQFITDKLIEAEVREAGIRITDDDVDRYIEQVKKNNRLSDEDFKTALARDGMNLASYKISVKTELEKSEILDRQVKRKVSITDEDVERYYKLNSKNYRTNERARFRHILLTLSEKAPADQVTVVSAKAMELYKRIVAGEDFATIAREYSEGAGRAEGGDIGWVNKGSLIAGLEEVAFDKLRPGQVSEPFRTSMGIHIVKLEAREAGSVLPLSAVAPKIKQELLNKALEERFAKWLKSDLRRKHRVDIKLAVVTFKPEDSKEDTVNSLMVRSNRPARPAQRSVLSYLNPLSYIVKETPFDEEDQKGPLANKSVVSIFGTPLFVTDTPAEAPDIFAPAPEPAQSKGIFSSIVDSLNPFSSKKP
jgi:peptidyl-prolyl cis-trans isomerase SurA